MIIDKRYLPRVLQVSPRPNYHLVVFFDDGSMGEVDAQPLLIGAVFAPLRDELVFREKVTVLNHTVAWDLDGSRDGERCLDLDPVVLYQRVHNRLP